MKQPLIGISGSHMIDQGGPFPGYKRSYVMMIMCNPY